MEEQCIIFDPSEENAEEYKKVHQAYKNLVSQLLEAFRKDTGLQEDEILKALTDMNSKADLKEIFQAMFEQVLAMDDYNIFVRIMCKKNIELQEQALAMLMQKQGVLPHSLRDTKDDPQPPPQDKLYGPQNEEDILKAVLEQSKREYDEEQARHKVAAGTSQAAQEQQATVHYAKVEQTYLENTKKAETQKLDQQKIDLALQKLSMDTVPSQPKAAQAPKSQSKPVSQTDLKSAPSLSVTPAPAPAPVKPVVTPSPAPVAAAPAVPVAAATASITAQNLPSISPNQPKMSSAEAAANWMKEANQDSGKTDTHSAAVHARAAEMAKMDPEELKKRQKFLKEQRDKLLEMKKKEREKTLLQAEKSQPKRPTSARIAKSVLEKGGGESGSKLSPEEEKKLAMRKAIADRLKAEMLGNK